VPYAIPVERRFSSNVQAGQLSLNQLQAALQSEVIGGARVDTVGKSNEPSRPRVMNSEIGRYAHSGEVLRGHRGAGPPLAQKTV
jgi:hypothetical protein